MRQARHKRQQGIALVIVLWLSVLLSLLVLSQIHDARTAMQIVRLRSDQVTARAAVEGAVARAIAQLVGVAGADRNVRWGGSREAQVTTQVISESGKVDINTATPAVLTARLQGVLGPAQGEVVADRILDWRDVDEIPRAHGAEREQYIAAGMRFGPRNGPFQDVREIRQVLGVDERIASRLMPLLTVYSGLRKPEDAAAGTATSPDESPKPGPGVYSILAEAAFGQAVAHVEVKVLIFGDKEPQYRILAWDRDPAERTLDAPLEGSTP